MGEVFKNVLILSLIGSVITLVLLLLKPLTLKRLSAKWQYFTWIMALCMMIIPFYKLIPKGRIGEILPDEVIGEAALNTQNLFVFRYVRTGADNIGIDVFSALTFIWMLGMCVYLAVIFGSYIKYTRRLKASCVSELECSAVDKVKSELGVRKYIRVRVSGEVASPLLVGVFFPTVYIPEKCISDEGMRMVLLHELTHYKRKDLIFKWAACISSAVHWFNPFSHLLCKNIGEVCEFCCDASVTEKLSESEKKTYMKTILDIAEERKKIC